ncbi:hypothetical protein A9Q99_08415 [Gammaproteobacteria bacterium 45_16_T64]|nr:hypothetical protein A9Q99_08415 [Gammaproteobacteria bacterium 45_16_T64]
MEMSTIEKDLEKLESCIANQDLNAAFKSLLVIFKKTSVHRKKQDEVFGGWTEEQVQYIATRLVGAVNFLFLQKTFKLNEAGFSQLVPFQSNYAAIVYLTPFKNSDFVIRRILDMDEDGNHSDDISLHSFLKMVFLWSPFSKVQLPFKEFLTNYPEIMTPVVLSCFRALNYAEKHSHENREEVVRTLVEMEGFDLEINDDRVASMVGPAWMNLSYASAYNKYEAKRVFNRSYESWMKRRGVKEPKFPVVRTLKDKPVLAIMSEALNVTHAMFRCYGDTIIGLKERFHTIGFHCRGCFNENVHFAFDEIVELPDSNSDIKKAISLVLKKQPDMLIYTSLGMNNVMIPMANIRLAPIQMAFLGHPMSTQSRHIDYIGAETCSIPYTRVFSEKIVDFGGTLPMYKVDDKSKWKAPKTHVRENKKQLDIAVPSMLMKLNHDFLSMLILIKERVSRNIKFHFFPHVPGITYQNAMKAIKTVLPDSVVHPPFNYKMYMEKLSACDLYLGPFPFNNSNGNVDALKVFLPMVVLRGDPELCGVEGVADVSVLEKAEAPSEMIADTFEEYYELALKMIEEDDYRESIAKKLFDLNLDETLYNTDTAVRAVEAVWNTYINHEAYQNSDEKVFYMDEPVELDEAL